VLDWTATVETGVVEPPPPATVLPVIVLDPPHAASSAALIQTMIDNLRMSFILARLDVGVRDQ
jgi:hypothetical protein